jgi:hypothetical protein
MEVIMDNSATIDESDRRLIEACRQHAKYDTGGLTSAFGLFFALIVVFLVGAVIVLAVAVVRGEASRAVGVLQGLVMGLVVLSFWYLFRRLARLWEQMALLIVKLANANDRQSPAVPSTSGPEVGRTSRSSL